MAEFTGVIPGLDNPEDIYGPMRPLTHEHVWISNLLAMFLYLAGSVAVVIAVILFFAPDSLGRLGPDANNALDAFGSLLRHIGSLFGAR